MKGTSTMNSTLFATLTVRAADGLCVHGTFPARGDAAVVAEWLTDEDTDTFARPIALHPPVTDPITTHTTADMTRAVIALPTPVADLLAAHDKDPDTAGEVVVSLLITVRHPAASAIHARASVTVVNGPTNSASRREGGSLPGQAAIHPLRRTDTVPVAAPTPGRTPSRSPPRGVA
jgi:hypothetical protein